MVGRVELRAMTRLVPSYACNVCVVGTHLSVPHRTEILEQSCDCQYGDTGLARRTDLKSIYEGEPASDTRPWPSPAVPSCTLGRSLDVRRF